MSQSAARSAPPLSAAEEASPSQPASRAPETVVQQTTDRSSEGNH
jgi:hypothetical protein